MSKTKKILIIVCTIVFLVCGGVTTVLILAYSGEANEWVTEPLEYELEMELRNGGRLEINVSWINIIVREYDGETVRVSFSGEKHYGKNSHSAPMLEVLDNSGDVWIGEKVHPPRRGFTLIPMNFSISLQGGYIQGEMTVLVPRGRAGAMNINGNGNVVIDGLTCSSLYLGIDYADVTLKNINCETAELHGANTHILDSIFYGEVRYNGHYENMKVENTDMGSFFADSYAEISLNGGTVAGEMSINNYWGNIELTSMKLGEVRINGNGNFRADYCKISGNLDACVLVARINNTDIAGEFNLSGTDDVEVYYTSAGSVNFETFYVGGAKFLALSTESFTGNGYGDLTLELLNDADVNIECTGGNVSLVLPADMGFKLEASSYSDQINIGYPLSNIDMQYDGVSGTVGDGARSVKISTDNGSVSIVPNE